MANDMGKDELRRALDSLGDRLTTRTEIVLGSADALILSGELPRASNDCDVLYSDPEIGRLQNDVRVVAVALGLPPGRPRDLADIIALRPTSEELAFARAQRHS
jgi:hypothetical protein